MRRSEIDGTSNRTPVICCLLSNLPATAPVISIVLSNRGRRSGLAPPSAICA